MTQPFARGYRNLAGNYTAIAADPCKTTSSAWIAGVMSGDFSHLEIRQDGFELRFMQHGRGRRLRVLDTSGAVVGSSFTIVEPMNSDECLGGIKHEQRLEVRLADRPDENLCVVTLTPR
jgi:hypothetical protein